MKARSSYDSSRDLVAVKFNREVRHTEKAVLLEHDFDDGDGQKQVWWPTSQIEDRDDEKGIICVQRWLAEAKDVDHEY